MKVLHVISGLRGGGAEHFVLELCRHSLKDSNVQMSVLSLSGANEIAQKFQRSHIPVIVAGHPDTSRRVKAFKGFRKLLQIKTDLVHAHMFHACVVACLLKLFRPSTKVVFTLHNNYVPQLRRRLWLFFTKPLRNADIVFPGLSRKWFQKKHAVVIPAAIDVSRYAHMHASKPPVFTCVFLGRLNAEKDPLSLITIAKSLKEKHNFMIRVAGGGPLRDDLLNGIRREDLDNHFILHGTVDDVPQLLAESHCLLITSRWEGMPLSLLEAAAAGIPVISTPVGNIPSLINPHNGYIGNINEFPSLIEKVMDNYGEALIRARALMQTVADHFDIASCYRQHMQVYRN